MTPVRPDDRQDARPTEGRLRALMRGTARRAGMEQQLVLAYGALLKAFEAPATRRNRRDDERARLVAAAVLGPASNCVDVGASEGGFLAMFTELAPHGRHIAYEPVPQVHAALARRFYRVEVRAAAVSDRNGQADFVVHKRLPSRSSLLPLGFGEADSETIQVRVETLDDSLPSGYVPHLVKIDVEGAEHLVLEGARRTFMEHRPVILFEHQKSTAPYYGSGPERVFDLLVEQFGMRIFDLDGEGPYSLSRLRRAYESATCRNFFAVPAGRRARQSG